MDRGHEVTVITGQRYRHTFDSLGARTTPLPPEVDFDDTDLDGSIPGRAGLSGLRLARFDLTRFVEAMPHQLRVVDEELDASPVDVVLCDPLFLAGMPLVLRPRTERPRALALGFLPLMAPLPALPPATNPLASARNAAIRRVARRFLRPITRLAHEQVRALTGAGTDLLPLDRPARSEGILQMTAPGFEYPRTTAEVPAPIHFVGPTTTSATTCGGTLQMDPLPDNVRVADFLPYDELLPRCDVMFTNGGYGGVNHALRYAVPLVCVGASEDKRDVAARVTWSGVGVGISRPALSRRAARRAVHRVLGGTAYRSRARELADQIAAGPSTDEVVALICGADPTRGGPRVAR
ncbi:glycosyltransferase [Serinicoccus marinus]|uniref:glycosyltransferase n=2 Tax=Serinicoccus marinus TaxID=247333 RepID=UPI001ED991EA|nr:nucleotide disphospho-sugar-binding domain-containing protein [Serinicoccus marinus]